MENKTNYQILATNGNVMQQIEGTHISRTEGFIFIKNGDEVVAILSADNIGGVVKAS